MKKKEIKQKVLDIALNLAENSVNRSIPILSYEVKKPEKLEELISKIKLNDRDD